MRVTAPAFVGLALLLAGCAASPGSPPASDPGASEPPPATTTADCLVGGPWSLDLPDYTEQAQAYLTDLGIPVERLEMSGSQTVEFGADGLMSVLTDVVSTGVIVTPDGEVPFEVRSTDGGSGDWSIEGTDMTIENWAVVPGEEPADPTVEVPMPDYSTLSPIGVTCQPGLLSLVGSDSPFVPLFHR